MAMVDMTMDAEEAKEQAQTDIGSDGPKYPWGLKITLDDGSLAKLGITSLPAVGTKFTFTAVSEVCGSSSYQDQSGEAETSLSLQITGMELVNGSQSNDDAATMLYSGNND